MNYARLLLFSLLITIGLTHCAVNESEEPEDPVNFGTSGDHVELIAGEAVTLNRDRNLISASFLPNDEWDQRINAVRQLELDFVDLGKAMANESSPALLRVRSAPAEDFYTEYDIVGAEIPGPEKNALFDYLLPVYRLQGGGQKYLTDELHLSFVDTLSISGFQYYVDSLINADRLTRFNTSASIDTVYLRLSLQSPGNALDLSNHYDSLVVVKEATPIYLYGE